MIRSRTTLAKTLAAAILKLSPSPPTTACCGRGRSGTGNPSTKRRPGCADNPFTARRMARWVARSILMRSISSAATVATEYTTSPWEVRTSKNFSRRAGVSFFESFSSPNAKSSGRITAAATTGPAKGPRPASSTPATGMRPSERAAFSSAQLQPSDDGPPLMTALRPAA